MQLRLFLVCLTCLFAASCFGPVRRYLKEPPPPKNTVDTVKSATAVPVADSATAAQVAAPAAPEKAGAEALPVLPPPPEFLEVEAWPGKWFVALEKPLIYCNYGYDLYTCPKVDSCRGPVDTALISKYHRARCDKFAHSRLKVLSVTPQKGEWIVAFEDEKTRTTLYARTTKGVFGEVALESDLDGAKKRFSGKTIYSARGFITAFDKGRAAGIKVRLQDPLKVYDVRFGLAPLPTKPLWLMVETQRGEKGAIPFYYSWTNVKKELRRQGCPWDDDLFEVNPENAFTVSAAIWDIINTHTVREGMTREEVRLSWGFPQSVKTETVEGKPLECWTYQAQRLFFDEKELKVIKEN